MRPGFIVLVLAGFLPAGCETPVDLETASYQRHYAEVGERMIASSGRLEKRDPKAGVTPSSSSTMYRAKTP